MSEWKTRITKVQVVKPAKESGEACLVLIYPPGPDMGKRFPLTRNEIVLGRGADCDIQVDRDSVSRRHARVYRSGDSWSVEDLQSTNGSYVNDVPVTKSVLRDADFLKIGAAIFKFLTDSGIEASYHEEIYKMTIVDALTGAHNKRYGRGGRKQRYPFHGFVPLMEPSQMHPRACHGDRLMRALVPALRRSSGERRTAATPSSRGRGAVAELRSIISARLIVDQHAHGNADDLPDVVHSHNLGGQRKMLQTLHPARMPPKRGAAIALCGIGL